MKRQKKKDSDSDDQRQSSCYTVKVEGDDITVFEFTTALTLTNLPFNTEYELKKSQE